MKTFKTTFPDLSENEAPKLGFFRMWSKGIKILFFGLLAFFVTIGPIWLLSVIFQGWKLGAYDTAFARTLDTISVTYLLIGMPVMAFKAFHWMGFKQKDEK